MRNLVIAFLLLCSLFAYAQTSKIAFLAGDKLSPKSSAIFNGIRNTAIDLSKRDNTKVSVEFLPSEDEQTQIVSLSNSYLQGYMGAVVVPVKKSKRLEQKIEELSKVGFAIVVLDDVISPKNVLCQISTDKLKMAKMLKDFIDENSRKDTSIHCYFKGAKLTNAERESVKFATLLNDVISVDGFKNAFQGRNVKIEAFDFYSIYAQQNRVEIMRRDNFGEVFFSPALLENLVVVEKDMDRNFAVCIGAVPSLEFYFATGFLSACIYDDFYGWGIFATRAIFEKKYGTGSVKKQRLISPILATQKKYSVFVEDWRKWLK